MPSSRRTSRAWNVQNIFGQTYEEQAQGSNKQEDKKDSKDAQHIMGGDKKDPKNKAAGRSVLTWFRWTNKQAAQGTKKQEDKKDRKDVQHIIGRHKKDPKNKAAGEDQTST